MKKTKSVLLSIILAIALAFMVGCTSSAYDIAVKNGYMGTEEQWLASLNGADGTDGSDLTINSIYAEAVENGYEGDFFDFLDEYLTLEHSPDRSNIINKCMRSAMLVQCQFTKRSHGLTQGEEFGQQGSGVIYSINKEQGSAYIITNYHVVYSSNSDTQTHVSDEISVTPYGGSAISVSYIGGSAQYDIAVLKAQNDYFSSALPIAANLSDSDVIVGQASIAIGNPAGNGLSATQGIISVDSETIVMEGIEDSSSYVSMRVMRIDAAVNSGNSGGGLFNAAGELIGIVNAKSSDTSIENMAYAIPSSIASAVADNIIKNNGNFNKGTVGITITTTNSKGYLDENGHIRIAETVIISQVSGAASGLLQATDVVKAITVYGETITVTRMFHLTDPILRTLPGDSVTITVERNGQTLDITVVCG
ncbi:MAG: trypsin-like peptidase domain-containing protein [Clostridia bacterium]|nr:trypsin-like peptidase domain-containing protein [Clostridia bacterium]